MNELTTASNSQYHANRTHLSSSMLKLILKDPAAFYRQWVLGERIDDNKPAFLEGSLTHTMVLEPEKITDYAVFEGLRRSGNAWEAFQIANAGKTIVTAAQMLRAQKYTQACWARKEAVHLLTGGVAEHTMLSTIMDTGVKARADYINWPAQYIVDVKTTSQPNDIGLFKQTVTDYGYDLSAALYCAIASHVFGHPFDFYWIVISKTDFTCEVYKASVATLATGTQAYMAALTEYKRRMISGHWEPTAPPQLMQTTDYEIVEV